MLRNIAINIVDYKGGSMKEINVKCDCCKGIYKILDKQYDKFDTVKCSICGCLDRAVNAIKKIKGEV